MSLLTIGFSIWAVFALIASWVGRSRWSVRVAILMLVVSSIVYAGALGSVGRRLIDEKVVGGDMARPYAKGVFDLVDRYSSYVYGLAANSVALGIIACLRRRS